MLNRILGILICILAISSLQAKDNTFKPVSLGDFLFGKGPIIPLKKHHQEMANRIFSVIDPKEEKWQIYGTYPIDRIEDTVNRITFLLVPLDFDTSYDINKKCDERFSIDIFQYQTPPTMETVIQRTKYLSHHRTPLALLEDHTISNQTEQGFIHEKILKKIDRMSNEDIGYLFGVVIKINDNTYHNYTFYQRYKPITDVQKEDLLKQFQQIAEVLQKTNFKRKK